MTAVADFTNRIADNVARVIVGKRSQVELAIVGLVCRGHLLLEDVPGTGKTMLARSLAGSLGVGFKRLQCTPDLLPNDVTGLTFFNQQTSEFEFMPGPVFTNILLVDEINRATPRTQSALLEAMQERQVTADGVSRPLPDPFLVLATQNPIEFEGTFPLPEAQLDRFLLRIELGYPEPADETQILANLNEGHPIETLGAVAEEGELASLADQIPKVHVDPELERYVVALIGETRHHDFIALGASPRASLALHKTSQAHAAMKGRDHVLPDDVKTMTPYVLRHRLKLTPEAQLKGLTPQGMVSEVLDRVDVPVL